MSKIENVTTPEEIMTYAEKDTVIFKVGNNGDGVYNSPLTEELLEIHYLQSFMYNQHLAGEEIQAISRFGVDLTRMVKQNGRLCGYVMGVNDDGSEKIALLGDNYTFKPYGDYKISTYYYVESLGKYKRDLANPDVYYRKMWDEAYLFHYNDEQPSERYLTNGYALFYEYYHDDYNRMSVMSLDDALLGYTPHWVENHTSTRTPFEMSFMSVNGIRLANAQFNNKLTLNKDTTLVVADPYTNINFPFDNSVIQDILYIDIGGAVYEILYMMGNKMGTFLGGKNEIEANPPGRYDFEGHNYGSYASYCKVFNVILTRSYEQAIRYINEGVLPTDAYLYPYDVDNIPINNTGSDPDPTPDPDPDPDPADDPENGDVDNHIDPTPTNTPSYGPQSLTNNNLYWLSTAQLKRFIDWFWTDATDIASLGDLWDKIQGLYENLAESIIAIRYMPINVAWIGGTGTDSKIIVGMIEKEEQVLTISKQMPSLRNLGTYNVKEKFKAFTDYSPYTNIMMYLPFHGFIDLDIDITQETTLAVQCAYDVLSGTIQYFIKRGGYNGTLLNTCISKIAVDIPITLQTKNQRDSAIFQNVASATANLIGAGASLATGNPIGLTMAMGSFSGAQTQGVPMSLKGTIGESGAFYQPTKCAIYIKHPSYNRPAKSYANHVGYPCNGSYKLSEGMGFIQVFNPNINFNGVKNSDDVTMKPYQSEIDEIYSILEKGAYA